MPSAGASTWGGERPVAGEVGGADGEEAADVVGPGERDPAVGEIEARRQLGVALVGTIAEPQEPADLDSIPVMRNWQKALLGQALIDALRGGAKPPQSKLF